MPDQSPVLSLPLILPAQAQKHVTHNEALRLLDVMVQLAVLNRSLSSAPALPAVGDRHIVATGAVGAWAGQVGKIALFISTGWQFFAPLPGWQAHVLAEGVTVVYSGITWGLPVAATTAPIFGVNATADTTNRLSVQAAATLFSNVGAGHQVKVNKAAVADTASLLFQTGFSGRAEMGLAGNDSFSIKVSPNGTTFTEALAADAATGRVSFAKPAILTGQASDPASPSDGMIWHNSTSGDIRVRAGGVTQVVGSGGVSDGDKGDITVSGSGAAWAIDAGAVTLAKMANMATDSFLGRDTAGTGAPEVMTPAQARVILNVADGATANSPNATLLDRANHTGAQVASTISNFDAAVAANSAVAANTAKQTNATHTGDASGATALTLATVNANVGAFGSATAIPTFTINAKGLTTAAADVAIAIPSAQVTDFTEAAQDAIGAMVNTSLVYTDATPSLARAALTGDVTAAVGSNATTIANDAVSNAKLVNMSAGTIKGNNTGAAADPADLTGTQTTAMLDTFTSALKGLVPASGGGTTTFLRADGAFATPAGGGGAPGGASGKVQFNNAAAFDGAANVEIDTGNLKLLNTSDPATPTSGLLVYAKSFAGRLLPKIIGPSGIDTALQVGLHGNAVFMVSPSNSTTAPTVIGGALTTATTISHVQTFASANKWQATRRTRFQTSTTAGNASGARTAYGQWFLGNAAGYGGFFFRAQFGMNINLNGGQKFCGMSFSSTAIAGEPSGLVNMCGMGYDSTDASSGNWQFMRNDGSGAAIKVDLGTGAARNTNDGYDLIMFVKPNSSELFARIVNLQTGTVVLDTSYTTDVPVVNTALTFKCEVRNGAVAAADNIELAKAYIETDY